MKPWTEARNNNKYMEYHSKLTYQLSFWNVSRKVDYNAGGKWLIHGPKRRKENQLLSLKHPCWLSLVYEDRDLFPWEMVTKMLISCLLNVEKIWNSAQINLSSTLNFLKKILFRRNNIHQEIDHWNRRWFGAKWHVTVPNSVAPVKPIVCKWIYMLQGQCCQMTHKWHVC